MWLNNEDFELKKSKSLVNVIEENEFTPIEDEDFEYLMDTIFEECYEESKNCKNTIYNNNYPF